MEPSASESPRRVLPIDPAEEPAPTDIPSNPKRFCGDCGSAWEISWTTCLVCSESYARYIPPPIDHNERPFRPAILLYFLLLAVSAMGIIAMSAGASEVPTDFFLVGLQSMIVIVACFLFRSQIIPPLVRRFSMVWLLVALLGAFGTFAVATAAVTAVTRMLEIPELTYSEAFLAEGYSWLVVVFMVAVQPAIIEELAFRGVILGSLQPTLSETEALLVSALMFMVLHLAAASFPHLFLMGLVLGYLRLRSGSLWPPILLHFVHNFLCVGREYYAGGLPW